MAIFKRKKNKELDCTELLLQTLFSSDFMSKAVIDFPEKQRNPEIDTKKDAIYPELKIPMGYKKFFQKTYRKGERGFFITYVLKNDENVILVEGEGTLENPLSYWDIIKHVDYTITIDDIKYKKRLKSVI